MSNVADALRLLPLVALKVTAAAAGVVAAIAVAAAAAMSMRRIKLPLLVLWHGHETHPKSTKLMSVD
jgi:hypothetical protein